jgi:hypothetical protein
VDGTFTTIDVPGSFSTLVFCIDDGGAVTGEFLDANNFARGFLRATDGTFTTFEAPGAGGGSFSGTLPRWINAAGVVAGFFTDTSSVNHGFQRATDGTLTVLDAPGSGTIAGSGTQSFGINTSGAITGIVYTGTQNHSFLRATDGTYTVFDPTGTGGHGSGAVGINDNGAIVGNYTDSNLILHGYLRDADGTFTTIDDPNAAKGTPLSVGTITTQINANGIIVGVYFDGVGARHGFFRQ